MKLWSLCIKGGTLAKGICNRGPDTNIWIQEG